jgi:hypothetical protein
LAVCEAEGESVTDPLEEKRLACLGYQWRFIMREDPGEYAWWESLWTTEPGEEMPWWGL